MGMSEETPKQTRLTLRPAYLIGITAVLLVAVIATLLLLQQKESKSQIRQPVIRENATASIQAGTAPRPEANASHTEQEEQEHANATLEQPANGYHGFEESLGAPIERLVRKTDFALMESLIMSGYGPGHLEFDEIRLRSFHGEPYHYQSLKIELDGEPERFLTAFEHALAKWAPEGKLVTNADGTYTVILMGSPTHLLTLIVSAPPVKEHQTAKGELAIVIDDMGQSARFARGLSELPYPVTFSILPHMKRATQVAEIGQRAGLDVLLHLPMEPKGYPGVRPGPGALFTSMSEAEILSTLRNDLDQVPSAVGVNNHMGSKFTQDTAGMSVVMGELKLRGLFFLDSLTTPGSVAGKEGQNAGLTMYRRNYFLDNIRDVRSIRRQLEKAQRYAARQGQAIAIGHPYPETLAALQEWATRENRTVRMVRLTALKPIR